MTRSLTLSEELAERDPALSQLAAAAVSGLAPAGPELRRKLRELAFAGRPGAAGSRYRPWAELLKRTFAADVETVPAAAAACAYSPSSPT